MFVQYNCLTSQLLATLKERSVSKSCGNLIEIIEKTKEKHLKQEYLREKLKNLKTSVINSYLENIVDRMIIKGCDINLTGKKIAVN